MRFSIVLATIILFTVVGFYVRFLLGDDGATIVFGLTVLFGIMSFFKYVLNK